MELDNSFYQLINGLIWPALAIFELIVVIIAHNKYRHSSTGLLLFGAVVGMTTNIAYPVIALIPSSGDALPLLYGITNILSLVGNLVFLVGLLQFVNYLASIKAGEGAISETFKA
jgi:hypothetical protein